MRQRIYIDTSVIGGYFDEEFEIATIQLFHRIGNKDFIIYFSEVNETELILAPQHIKDVKLKIPTDCIRYIEIDDEVEELAQTYIREKALGKSSENDAYHIALASVNRIDCLVSWNFKHIVNIYRIRGYNAINLREGHINLNIHSPKEIVGYEE